MVGFTETPKTTDPVEILKYFQQEAYKPKSEQKGIASKPDTEDRPSSVMKFFADWWTDSEEKVAKAREELAPDMEELARRSSEEAALFRMEQGITQSLPKGTRTLRPVSKPSMSELRDVTDTDEGKLSNEKPLRDFADNMANPDITISELSPNTMEDPDEIVSSLVGVLTAGSLTAGKDTEESAPVIAESEPVTRTTQGAGLMSPPVQGAVPEVDTTTAEAVVEAVDETNTVAEGVSETTFATVIKDGTSTEVGETTSLTSGFDSLTEAEGTDIHLDGRGFVTLPYGIVPDKNSVKKANGTAFDPTGSHGLKSSSLSGVDYSGATKFGISRTDYDNDQAFAKAVYAEFGTKTAEKYGDGFDNLTDEAKQAAYDMAWNAGIGSAAWSSVKTMLDEASKDGEKSKDSLIGFTTNFKSGNKYPRGLLKRRLQTYNLVANENEEASTITTSSSMTNGVRTGTLYTIKTTDGTVLKSWTKPVTNEVLGDLEVPQ